MRMIFVLIDLIQELWQINSLHESNAGDDFNMFWLFPLYDIIIHRFNIETWIFWIFFNEFLMMMVMICNANYTNTHTHTCEN